MDSIDEACKKAFKGNDNWNGSMDGNHACCTVSCGVVVPCEPPGDGVWSPGGRSDGSGTAFPYVQAFGYCVRHEAGWCQQAYSVRGDTAYAHYGSSDGSFFSFYGCSASGRSGIWNFGDEGGSADVSEAACFSGKEEGMKNCLS